MNLVELWNERIGNLKVGYDRSMIRFRKFRSHKSNALVWQ